MFGFNSGIMRRLSCFSEFNALRKNQLLGFYEELKPLLRACEEALSRGSGMTKYRDYYFIPQFEAGQQAPRFPLFSYS